MSVHELQEAEATASARRGGNMPMKRKKSRGRVRPFIAYDLETTRIAAGTPRPLYLTAYAPDFKLSKAVAKKNPWQSLLSLLTRFLLTPENNGVRFVAWNGNGYDAFLIARALLESPDYLIAPYLTKSHALRGMRVVGINDMRGMEWEFLDGMSMTGLDAAKVKLSKFVAQFAPQYPKLSLDFENEEFDASNPDHVAYAERDSEALYYAMVKAESVVRNLTGMGFQPTMGNLAIKYFQSQMPDKVLCWKPRGKAREVLYGVAKRGGYCWISRQYVGPVWKYDINQAYAAAMRDAELPCGSMREAPKYDPTKPGLYRVTISRRTKSKVPFYYREMSGEGRFTDGRKAETWILSTEIAHLLRDGWEVETHDGWTWSHSFNMREMVDTLERTRFTDPEGPSGPTGLICKQVGNSGYGKTLEQLDGLSLVMARNRPEGYRRYIAGDDGPEHVYCKREESPPRPYHQPQIGCFITAHVRIVVREAALKAPNAFLYADTDCVVFDRPVDFLDIDPRRYGAWKEESAGKEHVLIGKKIYYTEIECSKCKGVGCKECDFAGQVPSAHAKGLHVRKLTAADYDLWMKGTSPTQSQMQRRNFLKFMSGQEMFAPQERTGTNVTKSKQAKLIDGEFYPI
jgi:hypothetical protein